MPIKGNLICSTWVIKIAIFLFSKEITMWVEKEVIILLPFAPVLCSASSVVLTIFSPGFSVHGIFQVRKLEWAAIYSFRAVFPTQALNPVSLTSPELTGRFFTTSATWEGDKSWSRNNTLPRGWDIREWQRVFLITYNAKQCFPPFWSKGARAMNLGTTL